MAEAYTPTPQEAQRLKMQPDMLKVSGDGVFFSIQGEGQSLGWPSVFLRLHFCNLRCSWCDTKYTWNKKSPEFWQESQDWSIEKAVAEITRFPARRLIVTGGEPLIQQRKVVSLLQQIPDWDVEIETAGTISPLVQLQERVQFNVSPKLANSGNSRATRFKPDVLRVFNGLPLTSFKFVVQSPEDFAEIDQIVQDCDLDQSKVIIMPEGSTQEDIKKHGLMIVDEVKERGWRLMPRFHVVLWGAERGI
ncbi:7-carboxy-7-deazaguanine synthase QueE [Candidatus Daviesbacteria bacterium]|nr:7-carboxy-7-deazaguanine synthase QueE [Candidatus Daviesbacteria bacterium]